MYYKKLQLLFFVSSILIGLGLFLHTFNPIYDGFIGGGGMEQMDYPRLILGGWIFTSVVICVQVLRDHIVNKDSVRWKEVAIGFAMLAVFLLLFEYCGFIIASSAFFLMFSYFLGFRKLVVLLPLGIGYCLGIYLLFVKVLQISLPDIPFI